jgi:hypothetical protein
MFPRRRRAHVEHRAPSPLTADEQALRTAESIVLQAWAEELLRRRDHAEFAVDDALEDCDAARWRLEVARRGGDQREIGRALAALECAVQAGRASMLARDQVYRALRVELDLLTRTTRERMVKALVRQLEHDRPAINAACLETPSLPSGQLGSDVAAAQRERRALRWRGRLLPHRAAGLEQP